MRIAIDFDNTIACYDGVFHAAALERGLIAPELPKDKNAVRDFLNGSGRKDEFTALQGYVYGARMDLVSPYPGVRDFIAAARAGGHDVFIVSHKTKTPLLGPAYDMHAAACGFLQAHGFLSDIAAEATYFELTKEEKIARAAALNVDAFIDDLPEILAMPGFPASARPVLFDPEDQFPAERRFERYTDWPSITRALLG